MQSNCTPRDFRFDENIVQHLKPPRRDIKSHMTRPQLAPAAQLPAHPAAPAEPHELDRGEQLRAGQVGPAAQAAHLALGAAGAPARRRRRRAAPSAPAEAGDDADAVAAAPQQQDAAEQRVHVAAELELRGAVQAGNPQHWKEESRVAPSALHRVRRRVAGLCSVDISLIQLSSIRLPDG